jgi:hypothetical protein
MRSIIVCLSCVFVLASCLFSCRRKSEEKADTKNKAIYEDIKSGVIPKAWHTFNRKDYYIKYPSNFALDTSGYMKKDVCIFSQVSRDGDVFADNVCVMIVGLPDNFKSLENYVQSNEKLILQYADGTEIIDKDKGISNGIEYYKITYSEKQPEFDLIKEQLMMIGNGKVYTITMTCEKQAFKEFRETGEAIMFSFRFR